MPATNIAQRKKQTNGSLPHSELVDFTFDTYGPWSSVLRLTDRAQSTPRRSSHQEASAGSARGFSPATTSKLSSVDLRRWAVT